MNENIIDVNKIMSMIKEIEQRKETISRERNELEQICIELEDLFTSLDYCIEGIEDGTRIIKDAILEMSRFV